MEFTLENILWVVIIAFALYVVKTLVTPPPKYTPPPPKPVVEKKDRTLEEIRSHDGSDPSKPIFVAIRGRIYDVSRGKSHYGKGGAYNVFAGGDASRALAKGSLDKKDIDNPRIDDLTADEKETLDGWEEVFKGKYDYVGNLIV
eukprot:TRINITY_DN3745_c0_g1_i1.p1 TRINITY_DN3745_c0_g1~~TRINITY_DN3745_c0_g1_i1.p1  ORF type:complete len:144 (+),score=36.81 TRINITY_DN3745_c0_g1_i1:230-661(+)